MPDFHHCDSERFYEYWRSLDDACPPGSCLWDPVKIPTLMPNIIILERDNAGGFIHRFAGTGACDFIGVELTGRPIGEFLSPELQMSSAQNLDMMLTRPCGMVNRSVARSTAGRESIVEYVTLPLSDAEGVPHRLFVHMCILRTHGFGDPLPEVSKRVDAIWIDLGAGVPTSLDGVEVVP